MLDATKAVVPAATIPAHHRRVVVIDLNLQSESGDAHNDEVVGDDAVAAAEVVPPRPSTIWPSKFWTCTHNTHPLLAESLTTRGSRLMTSQVFITSANFGGTTSTARSSLSLIC